MKGPKVITLCGSSRFVQEMAVVAWILERDEGVIAMGLHLLPWWYSPEPIPDHLAEHEGVADKMDELHKGKIDLSDSIFVIDAENYVGKSTASEVEYAKSKGLQIRYLSHEQRIREEVYSRMKESAEAAAPRGGKDGSDE